ncbi:MAG: hypothetical protein KAT17_02905 [Candidatus Aminicenantes bacterium]|nr:hypothetical protein [Candidatus Aminicenantes bacterium]
MSKRVLFLFFILSFSFHAPSIELGLIGGNMSNPSELSYGFSGGFGLFIPLLKMEIEWSPLPESELNAFSASIKLRPKFGKMSPFVVIGIGTEFEKLGFDFDQYDWFSLIGGGFHYYFNGFFSFRLDIRFQNFSDRNRIRIGLGVFFHL